MDITQQITERFSLLASALDERGRRLLSAAEAKVLGYGGISLVSHATGMSRKAIGKGLAELDAAPLDRLPPGRVRRVGAGRKPLVSHQPAIQAALEQLLEPTTRGDPESSLRWTCKSVRQLSAEMVRRGYHLCPQKVADLLHAMKYRLQGNRKTLEGTSHPDRDAQFQHIQATVQGMLDDGQPVISVDAKKKELVGSFKNGGREWPPRDVPKKSRSMISSRTKAVPPRMGCMISHRIPAG